MTAPRRRGPAPRFSREQLVDAALAVVETSGFDALSLRSVARHLGVGPMTLYTYVGSSEELGGLVVDRLVGDAVRDVRWPRGPRQVLQVLARELDALVAAHPAVVEAYGRGLVRSGRAAEVALDVQRRLVDDGMTRTRAAEAYLAVHALVLGLALIRSGLQQTDAPVREARALDGVPLARLLDPLLAGLVP